MASRPYEETLTDILRTPEDMTAYLNESMEDEDPRIFLSALQDVVRMQGMSHVSRQAGVNRQSLYKVLSGDRNPRVDTLNKVLHAAVDLCSKMVSLITERAFCICSLAVCFNGREVAGSVKVDAGIEVFPVKGIHEFSVLLRDMDVTEYLAKQINRPHSACFSFRMNRKNYNSSISIVESPVTSAMSSIG